MSLTIDALASELRGLISEGLAPVALRLLGEDSDLTMEDSLNRAAIRDRLAGVAMLQEIRSLAADALLDRLCGLFAEAEIRFVVIKGPAVARFHPQGWPRPYNDIDVLVEPRQFRDAMTLLSRHEFAYPPSSLPPWPWFDDYCREGLNLFGSGDVDLHHHLAPWVFGKSLPSIEVIRSADHVQLRGRTVPMASREHCAVIAALHILNDLWKGQRGLVSWRDLLVIIRQTELDRIRHAFEAADLGWMLGLFLSAMRGRWPDLGEFEDASSRIPFRFSWRLQGLGWSRSTPISRHRLAWAIRLPLPQAAAFIAGSGLPSRRYVRARHGSYVRYWHQAWVETVSTLAGADHRRDKMPGEIG